MESFDTATMVILIYLQSTTTQHEQNIQFDEEDLHNTYTQSILIEQVRGQGYALWGFWPEFWFLAHSLMYSTNPKRYEYT